jgi:hypothetical protein
MADDRFEFGGRQADVTEDQSSAAASCCLTRVCSRPPTALARASLPLSAAVDT